MTAISSVSQFIQRLAPVGKNKNTSTEDLVKKMLNNSKNCKNFTKILTNQKTFSDDDVKILKVLENSNGIEEKLKTCVQKALKKVESYELVASIPGDRRSRVLSVAQNLFKNFNIGSTFEDLISAADEKVKLEKEIRTYFTDLELDTSDINIQILEAAKPFVEKLSIKNDAKKIIACIKEIHDANLSSENDFTEIMTNALNSTKSNLSAKELTDLISTAEDKKLKQAQGKLKEEINPDSQVDQKGKNSRKITTKIPRDSKRFTMWITKKLTELNENAPGEL